MAHDHPFHSSLLFLLRTRLAGERPAGRIVARPARPWLVKRDVGRSAAALAAADRSWPLAERGKCWSWARAAGRLRSGFAHWARRRPERPPGGSRAGTNNGAVGAQPPSFWKLRCWPAIAAFCAGSLCDACRRRQGQGRRTGIVQLHEPSPDIHTAEREDTLVPGNARGGVFLRIQEGVGMQLHRVDLAPSPVAPDLFRG